MTEQRTKDYTQAEGARPCPMCEKRGLIAAVRGAFRWEHSKTGRVAGPAGMPMFLVDESDECWLSRRSSGLLVAAYLRVVNRRPERVEMRFPWRRTETVPAGGEINIFVPARYWERLAQKKPRGFRADGHTVEHIHFDRAENPSDENSTGPAWKVRFALDLVS